MAGRARSVLFLPATNARAVEKARGLDCDLAILDLEDAVAPEMKVEARAAAVAALKAGGGFAVRVNGLETPWGVEDMEALEDTGVTIVVAPKIESAAAVRAACGRLPKHANLWAMIETPRALLRLDEIADAGGALEALMLGVNDLTRTLGLGPSPDREPLKPWLARTVASARAHGLLAIDGVFNRFKDAEGFAAECAQARLYGFNGKSLIHPSQVQPANAAFSPTGAEIAWAEAVVAAFAAPEAEGRGAVPVEGEMVERLHLEMAQRVLAH